MNEPTKLNRPRYDLAKVVDAIKDTIYEHGAGFDVVEIVGAIETAKFQFMEENQ